MTTQNIYINGYYINKTIMYLSASRNFLNHFEGVPNIYQGFQYCLKVRFNRPGRSFVSSSKDFGVLFGWMAVTPWKICLDFPPNIRTSPDSNTTLSALSTSLWSPYKKSALSPMEKETTGKPLARLSWLSLQSCMESKSLAVIETSEVQVMDE